jgi:hypothetical protein
MAKTKSVSLESVKDLGTIHFLQAEWKALSSRAVLIRYSGGGSEKPLALRLDMDKRAILDPVEDVERQPPEKALRKRIDEIWQIVAQARATDEAFSS